MPPIIQRTKTITGRAAGVKAPAGLGQDVAAAGGELGRVVSGIGDVVMQHREKQRLQDLKNKSIDIEASYDDEQRAYFSGESQLSGSDAFGNIERAEKFRDNSILKHTEGIEDPQLKSQVEGYIQRRSGGMMDRLSIHQANQRSEVSGQIRERKIDGILKDSFDSNEPVEESIERWQETIIGQRATGQLGEEEAAELLANGEQKIAEASLDGIVSRDPEAAIELIEAGAYDEYLDQKQIKAFDKQAKTLQKALDADANAKANEARKAEQDALKQKQKETGDVFVAGITEGSLTREQVLQSALDPTGANSKEHWLKEIEKREKKVKESIDETWETNPEVEADFTQRITEDPESVSDTEITDKLGQGLDNSTAKGLLAFKKKRLKGDKDPVKEQEEKTAIKRLSDAKTSRFFDPADKVNNSKLWAENVNNLQRYIQNHPDKDLGLYVDQILEPIKETWAQNLFDIISFGQPGKEEAVTTRQEELRIEAEDPKRVQAEQILTNAGKPVTKKNIDFVMGKL
jgi:hypothetical protein